MQVPVSQVSRFPDSCRKLVVCLCLGVPLAKVIVLQESFYQAVLSNGRCYPGAWSEAVHLESGDGSVQ